MNTDNLIQATNGSYTNSKAEEIVETLKAELITYGKTLGRQDGETQRDDELRFNKRKDHIKIKVQENCEIVEGLEQPQTTATSQENHTTISGIENRKKVSELNDTEYKKNEKEVELSQCKKIPFFRKLQKYIVWFFAGLVGATDGALLYNSLRKGGNGNWLSAFYATTVAVVIALASHYSATWTLKATTKAQKKQRIITVIILSFIFFFSIALMRFGLMQPEVSLVAGEAITETIPRSSILNSYYLTAIGWILFIAVYWAAMNASISDEEKVQDSKYAETLKELEQLEDEYKQKAQEIDNIKQETISVLHTSTAKKEYLKNLRKRIYSIGRLGLDKYIDAYMNYSNLPVPAYMDVTLLYNHNNSNNENNN